VNKVRELIIIRHGRSLQNIRESDDVDAPLSPHGEHQVRNIGKFLRDQFDLTWFDFYTSPFFRCLQTADSIHHYERNYYKKFIVMPELREYLNHWGKEAVIPNRHDKFPDFDWEHSMEEITFNLELNEEFMNRMYKAYHGLFSRSVIVTHGLPALALIHIAVHNCSYIPIWDHSISNAGITWIKDGRIIWRNRTLYDEFGYKPENYQRDHTRS